MAVNETKLNVDVVLNPMQQPREDPTSKEFNYSRRSQWLRAAILGANDGLVSTSSLMVGVGAVKADSRAMIVTGFAGLVAGACSMAIGEFVSVYSQLDVEVAQISREGRSDGGDEESKERLPSPARAAAASALAFTVGAAVPLLAAGFISGYRVRLGVVAAAASVALAVFGWGGAAMGGAPVLRACVRVVAGGWVAMGITFGLLKLFGSTGL